MKLMPINIKQKLSQFMHWFDIGSALVLIVGSLVGGIGGILLYNHMGGPGKEKEKIVLEEKVTHLMESYRMSQSMHRLTLAAGKGVDVALDPRRAPDRDKSFQAAFEAEAQAAGIALAHARQISPHDRYGLYKQLGEIQPEPDYFKKISVDGPLLTFSHAQSKVMDRPGFRPTVDTAREIVSDANYDTAALLGWMLGPVALSLAGIFVFCAARNRLDDSVTRDEAAIRRAEEEAQKAEATRQAKEAERLAFEAAERERISKLPIATSLDRDIRVRPIRLTLRG